MNYPSTVLANVLAISVLTLVVVLNRSPIIFQNLQIKSKSVKEGMNRRIFSC